MKDLDDLQKQMRLLLRTSMAVAALLAFVILVHSGIIDMSAPVEVAAIEAHDADEIPAEMIGTIDAESGLVIDVGYDVVKAHCGACHSTKLVTQNSFSREGWQELIRWMQKTQKLWDLGEQEIVILDYLEKYRAPTKSGRRPNLTNIEWYVLNE